jgi:hypothetical protein
MRGSRVRRILGLLLLFLFIGYYNSTTLFLHTHHYFYGDVTHSHPFSNAAHEHSANQLESLNALSRVVVDTLVWGACISAFFFLITRIDDYQNARVAIVAPILGYNRRGPPVA